MSRYITTKPIQTNQDISRKSTTIYPNIPTDLQNDIYIRTTSADRLDKLALHFYNDASMWWIIATTNGLGKGTIIVPPNTKTLNPKQTSKNLSIIFNLKLYNFSIIKRNTSFNMQFLIEIDFITLFIDCVISERV